MVSKSTSQKFEVSQIVLGIDPGVSGAMAVFFPWIPLDQPTVAKLIDLPVQQAKRGKGALDIDARAFGEFVSALNIRLAIVEQVQSRPRQGGQFAFGVNYGRVLGVLEAANIHVEHVPSSKWKQAMGLRGLEKAKSVELAAALFPGLKPQLFGPRGAGLDGRAEAILIAYYGTHFLKGSQ